MSKRLATRVLNVDDYVDNRELRSEILRARGYEVTEAGNGGEALRLAISTCPEVVLLDVNLPDMSGIEVCRRIKAHPPCEHTVVILVSATELATELVLEGYAEMMLDDAADAADVAMRDGLQEILSASRSATGITRNLLTFSRKQVVQLQTTDLNQVVSEFHHLVQRIIGEQIQIEVEIPHDPLRMKADSTQIQQVLMNLAVNARDAMPGGGRLTVRTGQAELQEHSLDGTRVPAGTYAFILVGDTGVGMSADVRERLFEPFFTTKEAGKGTGLGMAVVYGIVRQLGGYITVDSEPGRGTTFTMYFPMVEGEVSAPHGRAASPVAVADGAGRTRVLLVEDEEPVRTLTKKILDRAGYDVIAAGDAEEALQIFETATEPIGLILTDVVMPGMSGPDMLARILRDQAVPALLMSGYPDQGDVFAASSPYRMIAKPFTAEVLTSAVRETLEKSVGGPA